MRAVYNFNQDWRYAIGQLDDDAPDTAFQTVTLPHTNKIVPLHYFENTEYAFISTYRKRFRLPEARAERRVWLDFDGAMIASTVSINGYRFTEHRGGYTPFALDITDYLVEDGENLLTVHLDSTERPDIPPYGYVVDYLTFGGIYRDVALRFVEPIHISNIFVKSLNVLTHPSLEVEVSLQNPSRQAIEVVFNLCDALEDVLLTSSHLFPSDTQTISYALAAVPPIKLWSLNSPTLYTLQVQLWSDGQLIDSHSTRFGFREAKFRADGGFYLNHERTKLIGLNRHQTYPYIGAAAPARLQRHDADILKYELGVNIVRTSHYPQSPHFLNRCDEIGLLVFEEIPGWQHIGDAAWQALSLRDLRVMIERDRNHPSIILWGVRINESQDCEPFYQETNALARQLDPTRPTGGVRNIPESQFLEDVFTYNDFSNTIQPPKYIPHLVTEFLGHMYPTKTWDQEQRQVEHALHHARIQDCQLGMPNVAGAIGWCAFDYNTHAGFGSGDHVCYHGIMDIFRLPKYASAFYRSQVSPDERVVLQAATLWSMGDCDSGGINPLVVFSNCDALEVYIGESLRGRFEPDYASFPNLAHPPYQIPMGWGDLTWGKALSDLRLIGYLKNQPVAEQRIAANGLPVALLLQADTTELDADGSDMTRLMFKIVDAFGNRLPFANQVVSFEVDGPLDLIGDQPYALFGGQAALYVRTRHEAGQAVVQAKTATLPTAQVVFTLNPVKS